MVEATGDALAGIAHALRAIDAGQHVVMVNVEADVLCGPALARRAAERGRRLQPGLWRPAGADRASWSTGRAPAASTAIAAGKGTKYLPAYHRSTPDTVWGHYGIDPERRGRGRHEPQDVQLLPRRHQVGDRDGGGRQRQRPCRARRTASPSRPAASTTCRSCCGRAPTAACSNGRAWSRSSPRWSATAAGAPRPALGRLCRVRGADRLRRALLCRVRPRDRPVRPLRRPVPPCHLIGLELGVSVASAALRGEPTGAPTGWRGDVAAAAKRDLARRRDARRRGRLIASTASSLPAATRSRPRRLLPIGLATGCAPAPAGGGGYALLTCARRRARSPVARAMALRAEMRPAA